MREKQRRTVLTRRLIGPLALVAMILWTGPAEVWQTLLGARPALVIVAVAMTIPMAVLKGLRWRTIIASYGLYLPYSEGISMYAMGMVMAAVTPGRLGDFVKVVPLMKKGWSVRRAIVCTVLDRLWDVAFVLLVAYLAMWYFSAVFMSQLAVASILGGISLAAVILLVKYPHVPESFLLRLVPAKHRELARSCWSDILQGAVGSPARFLGLATATGTCWPLYFLAVFLCALAVDVHVPYLYLSACVAIATALSFVPITVAGAGTRDAVFILFLGRIGISRHESLAVASIVLAVFLANTLVFWAIWLLLRPSRVAAAAPVLNHADSSAAPSDS